MLNRRAQLNKEVDKNKEKEVQLSLLRKLRR